MNIAEEVDPDDKFAYPNRPAWMRFATIFAGPATNYLSAIILAFLLYFCHGKPATSYHVAKLLDNYDAFGKLMPGDRIVAIDHAPMYSPNSVQLAEAVNAKGGEPIVLTVARGALAIDVTIKPRAQVDETGKQILDDQGKVHYLLGIQQEADVVDVSLGDSLKSAFEYPVVQTRAIGHGLYEIVFGSAKADPGGPKRIVEEFSSAWKLGLTRGVELLMLLSVYLGMFNLLPLPALDGGRLVFLIYEMVTRRRPNPKIEATVHMAGIMVLGVVMILVTLHDFHVF